MTNWPKQNAAAMNAFYGSPDANKDGSPDVKWEAANLVSIKPPYRMVLAWDKAKEVKTIRVHKKCADSLMRILTGIKDHYGSQAAIERARMHLFGGVYNFRLMRGGSSLSIHSWAAAIDLDPERNGFGVKYDESKGMMPLAVVRIFKAEGWDWGGLWSKGDAMHFQAAASGAGQNIDGIKPAAAKPPIVAQVEAKPRPAAPTPAEKATASPALIEQVQRALIAKGYNEVGEPDGRFGSKTRGAILAFEADHALPLNGLASAEIWEAIMAAEPREVAPARAGGVPENNATIKASTGQIGLGGLLGGSALLTLAEPLVKSIEGGAGLVYRIKGAIEPIIDLWPLLALVAAGAVIFFAWRSRKAVVEDYRTGKLAR